MALTNHQRVGKGLDLLKAGLSSYVQREFESKYGERALEEARARLGTDRLRGDGPFSEWDAAALLRVMWDSWRELFDQSLGYVGRALVSELRDVRDRWAHQKPFSSEDAERALDSIERLLTAISTPEAEEARRLKLELRRLVYEEQVRNEQRKAGGSLIELAANSALKPWREVAMPHPDVTSGRYQQAEFAADLWQVYLGEGSDEYRDPVQFFRRTYLTDSLKRLLVGAIRRLAGQGGDPVVQLQTNFGGGKTHAMLALYHLFSGQPPSELPGVEEVVQEAGKLPALPVRRVVLVGNRISPGNPVKKPDGTVVRTLWGELAWQLGGREAFEEIRADDERATNPGDRLRELFQRYGPCLVLIDEWVAYARQLHDQGDLPGGSFETQFSFAQALTESAKAVANCLVVVSLPASDAARSDDIEVGGIRGREALERLRNVVGRLESSWRPATAEESFEIVRRRLFEPLDGPEAYKQRDVTARAFADFYRKNPSEFPQECAEADYERRLKAAYPIHPEVFDRLYGVWSTLVKFQRTRGVLRLMAAVVHSLWANGDRSPLILPASFPLDDLEVQQELTRYLPDNWPPIIRQDVDGPNALPVEIDKKFTNLGKLSATRRVARAIFLGSAPLSTSLGSALTASHRGLEDRRVKLGCAMPGESLAIFGDALRHLATSATYLYQDGNRFWYEAQPTVTKLAEERAEQLRRQPDKVAQEIERRLRDALKERGNFAGVHLAPRSSADVVDSPQTRLVVLSVEHPHVKGDGSAALRAARDLLKQRGNQPRHYRNALVFLAAEKSLLQDLEDAVCKFLAWDSILADKEALNLPPQQVKQAEAQRKAAEDSVQARLPEAYQWLLVPVQEKPSDQETWQAIRLQGGEPLAVRACRKLKNDELLVTALGSTILRKHLDAVPLWRGDHVSIKQLVEDFARYLYLPRLAKPEVLLQAIRDGLNLPAWQTETFAYADGYDESSQQYRGLRGGQTVSLTAESSGLLVKSEVAQDQLSAAQPRQVEASQPTDEAIPGSVVVKEAGVTDQPLPAQAPAARAPAKPKRFHASVILNPTRVGRDAGQIAEEVIAHLAGLSSARVTVTLEIEAEAPDGVPDEVVRIVSENSRALKFKSYGFEAE
jgi:predicted AAA+ superfamily ATPase